MASRRLEKPKLPDVKICLWEDLSFSAMDIIQKASTTEEIKQALCLLLCVSLDESDARAAILLDLYVYTLQFSKSQAFSKEQTSALFSIVKRLHQACTATSLGNVDECFNYFLELVLCHSVRRPPFSIDLFNGDEVKLVTDYIVDTYFRHFKLYKYIFTRQFRLDLAISYAGIPETPPAVEEEILVTEQEEAPPEEAEPPGESGTPTGSDQELRHYIGARLAEQVSDLRMAMEGQVREGEQRLNQRLAALEALTSTRSEGRLPRARRK
ncbi:coiled-coil domain-containing protein 189 [Carcharodon carcharias]|uniref:coiled-coil domain-containing protein 189 n=1 Tax=Carcharodon carcharias TaxID=13397 RepID=UPI001B7E5C69|nr:coiled-coil domain-containing protein 189 [Carcharodon carcharias]